MTKKASTGKKGAAGKKAVSSKKATAGKKLLGKQTGRSKNPAAKKTAAAKKKPVAKKKAVAKKPPETQAVVKKSAARPAVTQKAAAKKIAAMRAASKANVKAAKKAAAKSKNLPTASIKIQPVDTSGKAVAASSKAVAPASQPQAGATDQGKGLRMRSQPVEVQEIDVRHARARKNRLVPFFARSYGKKHKKATVKTLCATLSKHVGTISRLPETSLPGSVVEIGIFCIFAIGGTQPKIALEATKRSVDNFPNWNEFRISDAFEFIEFLDDLQIDDLYDRCEQVLEFVNEVYQDQNHVDLEYLREQRPEERLNNLNRYQSLGPALAQYLALALQDFEGILFHYSWARVVQRVGIVPRSGSPKILMQSLAKVFKGEDLVSLQVNLIQIGEVICQSKNQQCKTCYLVMNCASRKV